MIDIRFQTFIRAARCRAFTIIELLVAISILTLIVIVLYGLFDQVQRALRGNVAQIDVHEGGRAGMELASREMEQMQAGNLLTNVNFFTRFTAAPSKQALLNAGEFRENALEEVFFLSLLNKQWIGTGYRVLAVNSSVSRRTLPKLASARSAASDSAITLQTSEAPRFFRESWMSPQLLLPITSVSSMGSFTSTCALMITTGF